MRCARHALARTCLPEDSCLLPPCTVPHGLALSPGTAAKPSCPPPAHRPPLTPPPSTTGPSPLRGGHPSTRSQTNSGHMYIPQGSPIPGSPSNYTYRRTRQAHTGADPGRTPGSRAGKGHQCARRVRSCTLLLTIVGCSSSYVENSIIIFIIIIIIISRLEFGGELTPASPTQQHLSVQLPGALSGPHILGGAPQNGIN